MDRPKSEFSRIRLKREFALGAMLLCATFGCQPVDTGTTRSSAETQIPSMDSPAASAAAASDYDRGVELARQGRFAAAEKIFDEMLDSNPNHTDALRNRGACRAQLKRFDEALADLDTVIARNANDAPAHYNRGFALYELARYDEALEAYSRSISLQGNHAPAYVSRGLTQVKLGREREAIADYTQAIDVDPSLREAYLLRAEAHRRQFDFAKAAADVERANSLGTRVD